MLKNNKNRGFTLIELLVVLSITSLLSSIVLSSLNSARIKGQIGAGLQFDSGIHNAIGAMTGTPNPGHIFLSN
ncbi:MAG: type II secretion system protein [bacterium]